MSHYYTIAQSIEALAESTHSSIEVHQDSTTTEYSSPTTEVSTPAEDQDTSETPSSEPSPTPHFEVLDTIKSILILFVRFRLLLGQLMEADPRTHPIPRVSHNTICSITRNTFRSIVANDSLSDPTGKKGVKSVKFGLFVRAKEEDSDRVELGSPDIRAQFTIQLDQNKVRFIPGRYGRSQFHFRLSSRCTAST